MNPECIIAAVTDRYGPSEKGLGKSELGYKDQNTTGQNCENMTTLVLGQK